MGGFRWKTLLFYGILTLLTLIAIILVVTVNSKTKFAAGEARLQVDVILDAGHGGLDGGYLPFRAVDSNRRRSRSLPGFHKRNVD